jgi:hypothetical protein
MQKILMLFFILLPFGIKAQKQSYAEITQTDITKTAKLDGSTVNVFGLHLGMTKVEAKKLLNKNKTIIYEVDAMNTQSKDDNSTEELRYYVYDTIPELKNGHKCLLYIIWDKGTKGITSIVLFSAMQQYVKGDAKDFFTNKTDFGLYTNFYATKNVAMISLVSDEDADYYFKLGKKL